MGLICLCFEPKTEKKQTITKTLRLLRRISMSYTANCNFHQKSNFSSKTLILANCFAYSELVRPVCLRFAPKTEKKQNLTKTLSLYILASCAAICKFHLKCSFSSKTLIPTNFFVQIQDCWDWYFCFLYEKATKIKH